MVILDMYNPWALVQMALVEREKKTNLCHKDMNKAQYILLVLGPLPNLPSVFFFEMNLPSVVTLLSSESQVWG
jgi:hypothetical protein